MTIENLKFPRLSKRFVLGFLLLPFSNEISKLETDDSDFLQSFFFISSSWEYITCIKKEKKLKNQCQLVATP